MMTDEELLDEALPWVQELLKRNLLAVAVCLPATAIAPEKTAYAWPEERDHIATDEQIVLFVHDWLQEEQAAPFFCEIANAPPKPTLVE
jgi:hypothetical protein